MKEIKIGHDVVVRIENHKEVIVEQFNDVEESTGVVFLIEEQAKELAEAFTMHYEIDYL